MHVPRISAKNYGTVLFASLLVIIAVLFLAPWAKPVETKHPRDYYLSPDGSDRDRGDFGQPWKTLEHALSQLSPGDTLYLRGGVYYEHDLIVRLRGTASQPITIQSFPGERAVIDGGIPDFQNAPNEKWELVDPDIHLYRSKQPVFYNDRLGGWMVDQDIQLLKYVDYNLFTSEDYDAPDAYAGPGIHGRDGRIYIRLQQNPRDLEDRLGNPIPPVPSDPDPNNLRINIFSSYAIFVFQRASYVRLRNLDIGPAYRPIEIKSDSNHIEIDGCSIRYVNNAVLSREGTSDLEIHHCEVEIGFPPWTYWKDVKGSYKPAYYSGWNSFAIAGVWKDSFIHHNVLTNGFDGIALGGESVDSRVTDNIIIRLRDDAIDLSAPVANIEVARNIIRHSFEGISINNSKEDHPIGEVYIHHNIIDVSSYHRAARSGDCGSFCPYTWHPGIPFGAHDCADGNCRLSIWNIYNNTIVARSPSRMLNNYPNHTMYNNLVVQIGDKNFERLSQSAGNIFWRTEDGLSGFSEPEGLEVDPGLDMEAIEQETYDLATMRDRYRPTNPQVFTAGMSYTDLDWPGSHMNTYRGAVGPLRTYVPLVVKGND